jgi:hypothetical protein
MNLKNVKRNRIKAYADKYKYVCVDGLNVWNAIREHGSKADIVHCAMQNKIDYLNVESVAKNGCICVAVGAKM